MKTIAGTSIHQIKYESFNQDCLDLFKDLSVDSLITRILYIAATWTNSCYCICGLSFLNGRSVFPKEVEVSTLFDF